MPEGGRENYRPAEPEVPLEDTSSEQLSDEIEGETASVTQDAERKVQLEENISLEFGDRGVERIRKLAARREQQREELMQYVASQAGVRTDLIPDFFSDMARNVRLQH